MKPYKVSATAENELARIFLYLEEQGRSSTVIDRLESSFEKTFELLAAWPRIGRRYEDSFVEDLRCHVNGRYIIAYIDGNDGVEILHVMYASQDIERIIGHPLSEDED